MHIRENNWKPVFHIWAKMYIFFFNLRGPGGHSMIRLSLSCSPAIISPISMYMWNKEIIWKELVKLKSKIWFFLYWGGGGGPGGPLRQTQGYQIFRAVGLHHRADKCITRKKNITTGCSYMGPNVIFFAFLPILFIFGGPGGLTSNPGLPNFQGSKTSSQSRQIYNKGKQGNSVAWDLRPTGSKNNNQFSYMGPNVNKMRILGYSGGGGGAGWPINNQNGPILLPSYPLTYSNLHITYGSNPIRIF